MDSLLEFEHFSQILEGKAFIIMLANQNGLKKKNQPTLHLENSKLSRGKFGLTLAVCRKWTGVDTVYRAIYSACLKGRLMQE